MFHLFFGIEKALFELIEKHDETPVKNVTKRLFMNTFNTPEQIRSVREAYWWTATRRKGETNTELRPREIPFVSSVYLETASHLMSKWVRLFLY